MAPGLFVHVEEDLDRLATVFSSLLEDLSSDILEPLWTVVPSAPTRQWLDWRVGERFGTSGPGRTDGVSANLAYLFPEEFARRVERAALAGSPAPHVPWDVDRLTLRVMAATGAPCATARRVAGELDDLVRYRPEALSGPAGGELAALYHRLAPPAQLPLAQRATALAALARDRPPEVPDRVVLYGMGAPPGGPSFARLVAALGLVARVDVLLVVPSVTRAADIVAGSTPAPRPLEPWWRTTDDAVTLWRSVAPDAGQWRFGEPVVRVGSTLAQFQSALRGAPHEASHADTSLRVIGATGLARQVEVLRDVLVAEIASADLRPEEIIVVTPEPARLAPALERHWAAPRAPTHPRVPYELTAVAPSPGTDALSVSAALLALGAGAVTTEQIASVLDSSALRRTLGWDRERRDRLAELAAAAPVTFGVSPAQPSRAAVYDGPRDAFRPDTGTWQRLSDRVVTGVLYPADAADELAALGAPEDLEVVAALQPILRVLTEVQETSDAPAPVSEWLGRLGRWVDDVADRDLSADAFSLALERVGRLVDPESGPPSDPVVTLGEFGRLWSVLTQARAVPRVFGRFGVTVTDLASLPAAPHDVVCLVGFDEEALPATTLPPPALRVRRAGDPDARRAVLAGVLHATLAAKKMVIVTFSDRREDDGRPREWPTPLEELTEAVAAVSGGSRADLVRTSARHGFSIPVGVPGMVAETYDTQLVAPHVKAAPRTAAAPRAARDVVDAAELRRFLRAPARYYCERVLGAELPPDDDGDPVAPPITVGGRHRARLRREYLDALTDALADRFADDGVPPYVSDHPPRPSCHDAPCAWLHRTAWDLRQRVGSERSNRGVVPRLFARTLNFPALDLAGYNLSVARRAVTALTRDERAEVLGTLTLDGVGALDAASLVGRPGDLSLWNADGGHDTLTSWRVETHDGDLAQWRGALSALSDLIILTALAPERAVRVATCFLPGKVDPYAKRVGRVDRGGYAINPTVTLRFAGSAADARGAVATLVTWYQQATQDPVPLFPRTVVAASSVVGGDPRAQWSTGRGFTERQDPAHQLLFPWEFDELLEAGGGAVPLSGDLGALCRLIEFDERTQTGDPKRSGSRARPDPGTDDEAFRNLATGDGVT